MIEDAVMAISTGAAGNIVAYMLNGRVDALRAQVKKILRHSTEQERAAALRALEDDTAALAQRNASEADVTQQWRDFLLSYVTAHPEAIGDIAAFAPESIARKSVIIGSQTFQAPGSFGGDNNGTINIYPER
jgi:hypothetical protein